MAVPHEVKLALAEEILEDIELSRLRGQALLMKASRLARLLGSDELDRFTRWELHGYPSENEGALRAMRGTGRVVGAKGEAWFAPLANIIQMGDTAEATISAVTFDSVEGDFALAALTHANRIRASNAPQMDRARNVEAAVMARLHEMITPIYNELAFSARQAELFEDIQASIDARLSTLTGDALDRIDAVFERLEDGRQESISHALSSCRRLITAVADALYPPRKEPIQTDGRSVQLTAQHVLNRLEMYVADHDESRSRRKRLRRTVEDLWNRTSAGVHADVSAAEARFIFLHTYTTVGEIVRLGDTAHVEEDSV